MRQLIFKSGKYLFLSVILMFFAHSCKKDQNTVIPYVPFTFTVNLVINNALTVPGNSIYFPGAGFGGVVVYCAEQGIYYAFDAACTYEVSNTCIVKNEGVLGTCPCCGSQFVFIGGAVSSDGPAAMPLRQYNVAVVNSTTLQVYNN